MAITTLGVAAGLAALNQLGPDPDQAPRSPWSNNCSIDLTSGLVDSYWGSLNDSSEGSATDPDEPGVLNQYDFLLSRMCNNSTWLFLWAYIATPAALRNGFHFYLETTGDDLPDFDLLVNMTGVVELWSNPGGWGQIGLAPVDRIDFVLGPPTMEIGIELALIGSPETVRYFVTSETDAIPEGTFIDRIRDAGWTGPYEVPEPGFWSPFAGMALAATVLFLSRNRETRSGGPPGPAQEEDPRCWDGPSG